jgi:hypothetical protein
MRHCFAKPLAVLAACATALLPVAPAYAGPHDFPTKTPIKHGHLPAVSYLKAGAYQGGHAGYSDPIDEQIFL